MSINKKFAKSLLIILNRNTKISQNLQSCCESCWIFLWNFLELVSIWNFVNDWKELLIEKFGNLRWTRWNSFVFKWEKWEKKWIKSCKLKLPIFLLSWKFQNLLQFLLCHFFRKKAIFYFVLKWSNCLRLNTKCNYFRDFKRHIIGLIILKKQQFQKEQTNDF